MRTKLKMAPVWVRLVLGCVTSVMALNILCVPSPNGLGAQEVSRKIKTRVEPEYPELARRLNLKGIARVQVTVAPGGGVKDVKEVGGNPVLLEALIRAVKKWKYEPADKESVFEVKFFFDGS